MARCRADQRTRARRCAGILRAYPQVERVDLLTPTEDPHDRWTLDILLGARADGVGPQLLDELGAFGLTLRDSAPQGDGWQALATA